MRRLQRARAAFDAALVVRARARARVSLPRVYRGPANRDEHLTLSRAVVR